MAENHSIKLLKLTLQKYASTCLWNSKSYIALSLAKIVEFSLSLFFIKTTD